MEAPSHGLLFFMRRLSLSDNDRRKHLFDTSTFENIVNALVFRRFSTTAHQSGLTHQKRTFRKFLILFLMDVA